ncbi:MerR family transcriptional regulator [Rhodobacteraceae bacterium XHP0102]|nr:MerR family transcriptional regulator [Rhodobacteraceae bacterium XHP0102]
MAKSPDAFRTIREVADWLGVAAHVLRFWESKFSQIKPVKRAGGRRYYRPADMRLIGGIKVLLHDEGMTIRGVQRLLRADGVAAVASRSPELDQDLTLAEAQARPQPSVAKGAQEQRDPSLDPQTAASPAPVDAPDRAAAGAAIPERVVGEITMDAALTALRARAAALKSCPVATSAPIIARLHQVHARLASMPHG